MSVIVDWWWLCRDVDEGSNPWGIVELSAFKLIGHKEPMHETCANVPKAVPLVEWLLAGAPQQQLMPIEMGYYELSEPSTMLLLWDR